MQNGPREVVNAFPRFWRSRYFVGSFDWLGATTLAKTSQIGVERERIGAMWDTEDFAFDLLVLKILVREIHQLRSFGF